MKKILLTGLILASGPLVAIDQKAKPKALLFDLGGIFFDISKAEYAKEMGLSTIAAYLFFDWKNPGGMKKILFKVLENADIKDKDPDFKPAHDNKGNPMPYLLSAYQAGRYSTEDAKNLAMESFERLKEAGEFSCDREEVLVERALGLMFNPELYAERMIQPYPKALKLLKELKDQGEYIFVAVSNWDKDSSILVRKRFEEELSCFDHFVISGETGTVKPNKEIFDVAIEKSGVTKEECLFLDDQLENIEAAEKLGIPSMLYKNAQQARQEFEQRELLPVKKHEGSATSLKVGAVVIAVLASSAWLFSRLKG